MKLGRINSSGKSLNQKALSILRKYGTSTDLKLKIVSTSTGTATSIGTVTIANGGAVEVLNNKIWRII